VYKLHSGLGAADIYRQHNGLSVANVYMMNNGLCTAEVYRLISGLVQPLSKVLCHHESINVSCDQDRLKF